MTPPNLPVTLEKLLAHRAWVRTVARSLVADENDADDVEQQTWAFALARPPRHGDSMRGWLGAVARNVAGKMGRGRARRERREAQHASERATSTTPATADLVAEAELQQRIGRAVLELDEPYRETVLLRYFEGLAPRDVAERLGVPVETVRTRLRRAHERLRERLDEESGGRRGAWAFAVLTWDGTPEATTPNATAACATTACATTACATTAAVAGSAWMLKKAMLAAAVLVLVAAGVWVAAERRSRIAPAPDEPEVAAAPQPARERPSVGRRATAEPSHDPLADASPEEAIPAPVDLDAADRDRDLHGVVVDADGTAVPGARLTTVTYPWRETGLLSGDYYYAVSEGAKTRSAADGTFSLRLARGTSVALRVVAEGLAPVEIPSCLAGARVRVVLRPAVRLVVVLRDEDGQPVAGAPVRVFNNDRDGGAVISERGVTDAEGSCVFPDLPPERWGWIAAEPPLGNCGWEEFLLPVSGELRKEIRVPTGRTLTGRVVDAATGEAVAAARVGMNWTLDMEVRTAADGTFALPGWTGIGIEDVHVRAEGYAADSVVVGDQGRLEFRLERGFAAAGRVVGCDGAPLSGALVGLIASEHRNGAQRTSDAVAETDAHGAFRMTGLRRGMRHALVVVAPGNARLRRSVPPAPEGADLDLGEIRLARPLRLEGRVLDADGSPLPRVAVTVVGPQLEEKQPGEVRYGDEVSGFTDDLGRFRFTDLAAGPYSVTVRCPGGAGAAADVTLSGRDVTDLVIRRGATREVTVRVVDDEGAAVAGVDVYVYGEDDEPPFGRTDARGEVRLQVPPTNREVAVFLASHHGDLLHDGAVVELEPDQTEATFRVTRSAPLSATVLDPDGVPVAGAHVLVERADETWSLAVSGADGRFSTRVPRSGRVNVVFHGVAAREQGEVDLGIAGRVDGVAPGADVVLRCERIPSDRQLTVLVRAPSGDPVAGALVHVNGPVAQVASGRTDTSGRAAFEDLPARPLGVSVAGLSAATATATVLLQPLPLRVTPAGQEIALTCRAAVPLRGIALDADGRPARGHVRCLLDGEFVSTAPLDADGRFAVLAPADEPGPFRVELLTGADTVAAAADDARPGGPDLRLAQGTYLEDSETPLRPTNR